MPAARGWIASATAGLLALALVSRGTAQSVSIERQGAEYKVVGWAADPQEPPGGWLSLFAVYAGDGDVPPLLGSYVVRDGVLFFQPRYPIAPDIRIRAVFHPPAGASVEAVFDADESAPVPSAWVEAVYPSADVLPDNQLKLYIQFSAPMSRGEAWQRIHLLDEKGSRVDLPFLEIDQELWDPDNRRLTVLFDPGRIKRGVLPREQMGPSLIEGQKYTLVIDQEWQDARGAPLVRGHRKQFRAGPSDREPPQVANWLIATPRAYTTGSVVIAFREPMDWALLHHLIQVSGPDGPVAGAVLIEEGETQWRFLTYQPWQPGDYQILVNTALEDLAGNKIGRAFDVDLDQFDRVTERVEQQTVSLRFRVGSEPRP